MMAWIARRTGCAAAGLAALAVPAAAFAQESSDAAGTAAGAAVVGLWSLMSLISCVWYAAIVALIIGGIVLWVLALVDVIQRNEWEFPGALEGRGSGNEKVIWLIVVLLASYIGALVYYITVMKKYPRRPGSAPPASYQPPAYQPPVPPPGYQQPPAAPPATEPPPTDGDADAGAPDEAG